MRIIKCGRREIAKNRTEYVNQYNTKKAKYDAEVAEYRSAKDTHLDNIQQAIREAIGQDVLAPFGNDLEISVESYSNYKYEPSYKFILHYIDRSDKPNRSYDYSSERPYFRGVPFRVVIQVAGRKDDQTGEYHDELVTTPSLTGDVYSLSPRDYDMLTKEIELFKRINNIDWTDLINQATRGVQRSDYVTTENPGSLDTSMFDKQLIDYDIANTQNKDSWLFVYVKRSESFDQYSSDAPCPEVYQYGWVKLVKSSPAYYYFYWLEENSPYMIRNHKGLGLNGQYQTSYIEKRCRSSKLCKLKKLYFSIPENHPLYCTEDELCSEELDTVDETAEQST